MPCASISGHRASRRSARGGEDRLRARRRARQRVRARGAGEVVEAQPEDDRAARRAAGSQPPRDAVDEADEGRVDLVAASSGAGRARAASRSNAARRPTAPVAGRGCAPARAADVPTHGRASRRARARRARATWPTREDARGRGASAPSSRRRPTAAPPAADAGTPSSSSGGTTSRPSGFATPLATFARNFVRATPTVIGRPTSLAHLAGAAAPRSRRRARRCGEPADVEERLVDGEALDERRRVVEHREDRLARLGVRRHPRRDDDRVRAQAARLAAAHRRAHAVRLRLVARGEHDPAADDDRPAAQSRIVALLDRREECIEVGVEDGCCGQTNICSHHTTDAATLGGGTSSSPAASLRGSPRAHAWSTPRTPRSPRSSRARRRPRCGARPRRPCTRPSPGRPDSGARRPRR